MNRKKYQGSLWELAVGQTYIRLKFQNAQTGVTFCEYSAYKEQQKHRSALI